MAYDEEYDEDEDDFCPFCGSSCCGGECEVDVDD